MFICEYRNRYIPNGQYVMMRKVCIRMLRLRVKRYFLLFSHFLISMSSQIQCIKIVHVNIHIYFDKEMNYIIKIKYIFVKS